MQDQLGLQAARLSHKCSFFNQEEDSLPVPFEIPPNSLKHEHHVPFLDNLR